MYRPARYAAFALSLLLPSVALASPTEVHVQAECSEDSVGERLAYKVKEGIRKSASMTSVNTYIESLVKFSMVCLDPGEEYRGITRYSYAITTTNTGGHYDYLLLHGVGSCGTKRVDECADTLVADIDLAIEKALARVKDGTFRYKPTE